MLEGLCELSCARACSRDKLSASGLGFLGAEGPLQAAVHESKLARQDSAPSGLLSSLSAGGPLRVVVHKSMLARHTQRLRALFLGDEGPLQAAVHESELARQDSTLSGLVFEIFEIASCECRHPTVPW